MTHDELLARLYEYKSSNQGLFEMTDLYQWREALRAVMELHKPCEPVSEDQFITCETCNYRYHREFPWPCETIQAIAKELR